MKSFGKLLLAFVLLLFLADSSVAQESRENHGKERQSEARGEHGNERRSEARGEHGRERSEGREGEEKGAELSLSEKFDKTKRGVRLYLAYNKKSNAFEGYVTNVSNKPLQRVRVEIHLSNGTELGPTTPAGLAPGEKKKITLKGTKKAFSGWAAHAEVGNNEHGEEGSSEGHGSEGGGEHGGEGEG